MNTIRSGMRLSGCSAAMLALLALGHADRASAATRLVTNCNDHGLGSLRHMVKIAASGDTVDLQNIDCRRIDLSNGEIAVPQSDLTIVGPGRHDLTIDGNRLGRIFSHTGTGTLRISSLSITRGYFFDEDWARGGCIYSMGDVELRRARVSFCYAIAESDDSSFVTGSGGGVYAKDVLLWHSSVWSSEGSGYGGFGGGVYASGRLTLYHAQLYRNYNSEGGGAAAGSVTATASVIRDNRAYRAGGLSVFGRLMLQQSTVSGNIASACAGGLCVYGSERSVITGSTISNNSTYENASGISSFDLAVFNSTIAFNASGLCGGALQAHRLHAESTIIAGNTGNNACTVGTGVDVYGDLQFGDTVVGARNLIGTSTIPLPADTIRSDPRLAPLADNGGPTLTHALLSDSPAIDKGSNLLDLLYDQRGPGYPRVNGRRADIGAFER